MVRVLLVEDDDGVASAVCAALRQRGILVDRVARGVHAVAHLSQCDVVVIDVGLPDIDGFSLCRKLRCARSVPIIMATARSDVRDRIRGLDCGADDYVVKPYHVDELLARIRAVLRRGQPANHPAIEQQYGVAIDNNSHRVQIGGVEIALSPTECRLFSALVEGGGSVCSRQLLVAAMWGRSWSGADRALEVNIAAVRKKLGRPEIVQTIRGVGYRFNTGEIGPER